MYKEPYVHQIFIGKTQTFIGEIDHENLHHKSIQTSIFKQSHETELWLGEMGLVGDEEDTLHKALYAYPIKHYAFFEDLIDKHISYGSMGENLAVLEMDEYSVCIGDVYQFGDALIQVSQPHLPHWEIAYRFKYPELALNMQEQGLTGWYFRVIKEGNVYPRVDLKLIDRPYPLWTIAACNEFMHYETRDFRSLDELSDCPALSPNWQKILRARLRGQSFSSVNRLLGPYQEKK